MNHISCSGQIKFDSQKRPKCPAGWTISTTDQLKNEIGNSANDSWLTPQVYEVTSAGLALIMLLAFGWRLTLNLAKDIGKNNDD